MSMRVYAKVYIEFGGRPQAHLVILSGRTVTSQDV